VTIFYRLYRQTNSVKARKDRTVFPNIINFPDKINYWIERRLHSPKFPLKLDNQNSRIFRHNYTTKSRPLTVFKINTTVYVFFKTQKHSTLHNQNWVLCLTI